MDLTQALFLGIIQGVTEFLPVSSSGHLVIFSHFFGLESNGSLEVLLHAGTALSVIIYYLKDLIRIDKRFLSLLVIGSIPAGIVGIILSDFIDNLFASVSLVALMLLATGVVNLLTDRNNGKQNSITPKKAFLIGLVQAVAIIPGISRSGSTIFAASRLGINKKLSAKFSFMLSLPAIAGANLLVLVEDGNIVKISSNYVWATVVAFVLGLASLWLLERILITGKFKVFGIYCLLVGLLILIV